MAATPILKCSSAEGEVVHLRLPPDLHDAFRRLAAVNGRSITGELVYQLDRAVFGPRELRMAEGRLGKN